MSAVHSPASQPSLRGDSVGSARVGQTSPIVVLRRRTIDFVAISAGILGVIVLLVAGGLLRWGNSFSSDYVQKELSSQHISFPPADALTAEGRSDLLPFAGKALNSGKGAQAYASFINGHLAKIGAGKTFADLGQPETAAKAAVTAAVSAGQSPTQVSALQVKADAVSATRNTLFKGETLRGLLLSAYAWATVGRIAGIASIAAFFAAFLLAVLVVAGVVHLRSASRNQVAQNGAIPTV